MAAWGLDPATPDWGSGNVTAVSGGKNKPVGNDGFVETKDSWNMESWMSWARYVRFIAAPGRRVVASAAVLVIPKRRRGRVAG